MCRKNFRVAAVPVSSNCVPDGNIHFTYMSDASLVWTPEKSANLETSCYTSNFNNIVGHLGQIVRSVWTSAV
jgi:hypothetical protein